MSTAGLESIDHSVQLTHIWINELDALLGWDNKHRSYRLLRTVLQAIRDWLPVNKAAAFGAQLPELLRGVYYEQWRPATTPVKPRSGDSFIHRVEDAVRSDPVMLTFMPEVIAAVFILLNAKISAGEIEDVRHVMPADVRALWPLPLEVV